MARRSGRYGKVLLNGVDTAGTLTSFSISMKRKRVDVTCMGDSNTVQVQGLPDWNGDIAGFWDDTKTVIFNAQATTTYYWMWLYFDYTNLSTKYAYGPANLDLDVSTKVDGAVEFKGTWSAAGSWLNTFGA